MKTIHATKSDSIQLSGNYILTNSGIQYCTQSKIPIQELRSHTGRTVEGFVWTSVDSSFIERSVAHGLLEGIEVKRLEFVSRRKDIMRLVTCVFDGILLKRFRPQLKARIRSSEHIRAALGRAIDPSRMKEVIAKNRPILDSVKNSLKKEIRESIGGDPGKEGGLEKNANLEKLIHVVDDEIWFLCALFQNKPIRKELESRLRGMLISYVDRMGLSEYIALIVMEFVQFAEKAHFLNLAERDRALRKGEIPVEDLLLDGSFREHLVKRAEISGELIILSIEIGGNPHDPERALNIKISIRNKGLMGYRSRNDFLNKKIRDVRMSSFASFLREINAEEPGGDLGLFYLDSLEELCGKESIGLKSSIIRDERKDETVSSIDLSL